MKYLIGLFVILLSGCAPLAPLPPVDAAPVNAGNVKSAFGATVTARDWNSTYANSGGADSQGTADGGSKDR